jgi:hypothetical protein
LPRSNVTVAALEKAAAGAQQATAKTPTPAG